MSDSESRQVTVDLADLEALVFASAAIKTIESTIASWRKDPFVQPYLQMSDAHNRLASAMRNARRADLGTLVNWDEPLTEEERKALVRVNHPDGYISIDVEEKLPNSKSAEDSSKGMSVFDRLAAKGCLVYGQRITGVLWAGDERPQILPDPSVYLLKITPRGIEKLREHERSTG